MDPGIRKLGAPNIGLTPEQQTPPLDGTMRLWCSTSKRRVSRSVFFSVHTGAKYSEATLKSSASESSSGKACSPKDSPRLARRSSTTNSSSARRLVDPSHATSLAFSLYLPLRHTPKLNPAMGASQNQQQPAPQAAVPAAVQALHARCQVHWAAWDATALRAACAAEGGVLGSKAGHGGLNVSAAHPSLQAAIQQWLALASFMLEGADALAQLEDAFTASQQAGDDEAAMHVVQRAVVLCVLDPGAMQGVREWLARWQAFTLAGPLAGATDTSLWRQLAPLAVVVLSGESNAVARGHASALQAGFRRLQEPWSANECLMAAQVLIEFQFIEQRYEAFDLIAMAVEGASLFEAAAPLMRARWHFTYGYSQHLTGRAAGADKAWTMALELAQQHQLRAETMKVSLALVKAHVKENRLDAAQALVDSVQTHWAAGRVAQLVQLLQQRARLHLLRGRAASALSLLEDALKTAEDADLVATEFAGCRIDLVQSLVALGRLEEAEHWQERNHHESGGREAHLDHCLLLMLRALGALEREPSASRKALAQALELAQQIRYTTFFMLLPATAGELCAWALRWQLSVPFVLEVIRARAIPAPADAGALWPWPVYVQLLGGFELRLQGAAPVQSGKAPQKPLELLRLLACQRRLALSVQVTMDALWPEAEVGAARKNFDATVHRLRPLLGDPNLLWVTDGTVGLDSARVASDVALRRDLIDRIEALSMARAREPAQAQANAKQCLALVARLAEFSRGELLPGAAPTPWLLAEQALARRDTVRAALAAAALPEHSPSSEAECELLQAALLIEPLSQALALRLMQAHERRAQRSDALRVYEFHRQQVVSQGLTVGEAVQAQWHALMKGHRTSLP
jgi:DNA-binding SARP family transcriptional activator